MDIKINKHTNNQSKINIIKKDYLPEDAKIVGVTTLKEVKDDEDKKYRIVQGNKVEFYKPGDKKGFIKGYVKIDGKDEYLQVVTLMPFIILIFAIIAGLIVIGLLTSGKLSEEHSGKTPLPLDPSQGEYVEPEKEINHSQTIFLAGWTELNIPANTTTIDKGIDFYNPSKNSWLKCPDCGAQLDKNYKCTDKQHCGHQHTKEDAIEDCYYMTFALYLEDNNEKLYESGLVAPGKHLQNITFTRPLAEGEYNAYLIIQPYKSDRATKCNIGKEKMILNVY